MNDGVLKQYVLDEKGELVLELDDEKWGEWYRKVENRQVAHDELGGVYVSTIFLGLDHNFGDGPPQLFETMVFDRATRAEYDGQRRYSTRAEALEGHQKLVEVMRERLSNPPPRLPGEYAFALVEGGFLPIDD